MKVYFQNSQGEERLIATVKTEKQMYKAIEEFCSERGFTIPYYRSWFHEGRMILDVGSYTEFFIVDGSNKE